MWQEKQFFIISINTLEFFMQWLMIGVKLTQHWKVEGKIDAIERLRTKLKYSVKDRDQ